MTRPDLTRFNNKPHSAIIESGGVAALSSDSALLAPVGLFSVVCDSLRLLSAFGWGREGRLSRKSSAQLCDLMNPWN